VYFLVFSVRQLKTLDFLANIDESWGWTWCLGMRRLRGGPTGWLFDGTLVEGGGRGYKMVYKGSGSLCLLSEDTILAECCLWGA